MLVLTGTRTKHIMPATCLGRLLNVHTASDIAVSCVSSLRIKTELIKGHAFTVESYTLTVCAASLVA